MVFWLVLYLCCVRLPGCLTLVSPVALSLLHNILKEHLGHCLTLPYVPWFFQYVLESLTSQRRHSGLTLLT